MKDVRIDICCLKVLERALEGFLHLFCDRVTRVIREWFLVIMATYRGESADSVGYWCS